jgi:3-phytase
MTDGRRGGFGLMTAAALLAGCASVPAGPRAPTASVPAAGETVAVGTANQDAADDPAIWAAAPGTTARLGGRQVDGFIAGTDKKAGLYVYGLDGRQLQFLPDGLLNNADLRDGIEIGGRPHVVLGASDRGRMGVALYLFDPASADPANAIRPWGFVRSDVVEPYGFCMATVGGALHAILIAKDGQARQYRIDAGAAGPVGTEVRRFAIGTQSEGCVADEAAGHLYVGEEMSGVWRYGLAPEAGAERIQVAAVGGERILVADVEGVTIIEDRGRRFLLVSSQGDSAFAVWRLGGAAPAYAGRFEVAATGTIDAVTGTDGLDARSGPIGPFPEGLVVVQDDRNEGAQNFKLVDWREVRRALALD